MHQYMGEANTAESKHPFSNPPGLSAQEDYGIVRLLNKCNKEPLQTIKLVHHSSSKTFFRKEQDHNPSTGNSHT